MGENNTELIIYQTEDGKTKIDVHMENETVWLSLDQMAELFQRDKSTISKHIKNIFAEGELTREAVVANFATTASRSSSPSAKMFLIWREIVDLSRWNKSAIWSMESQTVSPSKVVSILVRPSSVV